MAGGTCHDARDDFDAAIADYDDAIACGCDEARVYFRRGNAHYELEDYDRAIANYSHALRRDPEDAATYIRRGHAYRRTNEFDLAIADYGRAIEMEPGSGAPYYYRSVCHDELGNQAESLRDATNARTLGFEVGAEPSRERPQLPGQVSWAMAKAVQGIRGVEIADTITSVVERAWQSLLG